MARQSHGRNHVFRHNVRLVADNHRVQRHVVKSVANQRRQTIAGNDRVQSIRVSAAFPAEGGEH
jgi:hypothetical protein